MSSQQKVSTPITLQHVIKHWRKCIRNFRTRLFKVGDRTKHSVQSLSNMVYDYVPRSTDDIRTSANGGLILGNIIRTDWLHDKASWQLTGINAGSLPDIVDQNGYPAPMTMNGIPIDITDIKIRYILRKMTNFLLEITMEALHVIQKTMEELAAMLAADVPVMRNGYRTISSIQYSSFAQGLIQFQDTLEKILRLVGDIKSELGLVRKSTSSEHTNNVEAPVQRRKQSGQRNNDKSDKQRKFANIAIQKPHNRKSHPIPPVGRIVSVIESDDEPAEEVAQFAGVVEDVEPLHNIRIMTAHNKETVLGSAFSRFQWLDSGEAAIGSKIGTTRFNSMRIDHDITHHNAGQSPNINEPLGYYPFNEQALVSKHDDKEMNDMEDEDDYYVRIGKYHPTDISVPGSMEAAERAQERRKLKMEIMRGLADEPPADTSTCFAPETSSARLLLQAVFSPSAPQVEYNLSDYMACKTEGAQDLHAPKGREPDQDSIMMHDTQAQDLHAPKGREPSQGPIERRVTRSVTRIENLNIPPAAVPSDSDEENVEYRPKSIIVTPFGSSLSPKAFLEQAQRRSPMTPVSNYVSAVQARHLDHLKDDTVRYASHSRLHSARPADWEDGEM
jgi:hypothetical protein